MSEGSVVIVHNPKEKLVTAAVFVLPLVLVKMSAVLLGGGPEPATGSTGSGGDSPDISGMTTTLTWTGEQRAAAEHIRFLRTQPFGPSPLFHVAAIQPDIPDVPDVDPVEPEVPVPDVAVQMILTRTDGNHVALINRRRYREGEALLDQGWIIKKIDGQNRCVIIEHPGSDPPRTTRTETLVVPMPR